jgi:hypothetical protein
MAVSSLLADDGIRVNSGAMATQAAAERCTNAGIDVVRSDLMVNTLQPR